ncbi:ribosome biogenesis protein wdr12-like [Mytilus trossulus]|uniref:ribosome biogenesis protein wdr12-like n=1 Tax=Mytilus trossulus TaxID=6551 RepID=UPI0030049CD1
METNNIPHVQARFFTKQPQFSVPSAPFSVQAQVGTCDLSSLINSLLNEGDGEKTNVDFDFLIDGEFLRLNLDKHLENKGISTESLVDIEYIEKQQAPEPEDSLVHDDWVSCIQGCKDCILSGCYDNTVRLWSVKGSPFLTIPGHSAPVKCVQWITDDDSTVKTFMSGSHDQTIHIWQWDSESNSVDCVAACRGHAGSVDCINIDHTKQRFCSGSWDKMLKLWSAECEAVEDEDQEDVPHKKRKTSRRKVQTRVPILTLSGHNEGISAVEWIDTNQICTSSWDHTIKTWDLEQAEEISSLQGSKVFLDMSYSPLNRQIVTGSSDRHVRLWDPRSSDGALVKSIYTSHTGWVSSVCWSKTNEFLFISGSYDSVMKLWDTRSPKAPLYNMTGHDEKILAVDWSIPSSLLSGGADNHLKIFQYKQ